MSMTTEERRSVRRWSRRPPPMTDYKSPGGDVHPAARAHKLKMLAALRERADRGEELFAEETSHG